MNDEFKKICIPQTLPIKDAVRVLNDGHKLIVLIVDAEDKLLGVITDSDVRRAILRGISFDLPVSEIMVTKPVIASTNMKESEIFSLMQETKLYEIPVLDHEKKVVGLRMINGFISKKQRAEVIIMAGGLGMRLEPLTNTMPKPLITVGGKPILFIVLDQLIMAGFQKITLAINYKADMIRDAISAIPNYINFVNFIEEKKRMGTAGALSLLENPPEAPFFVMNADLLTKADLTAMLRFHEMEKNQITIATLEEIIQVPFGVLKLEKMKVLAIEEKPVHNYFANAGIYVLDPSILNLVSKDSFYDMPDLINDAIEMGKQVGGYPIHEYWLDIGRHDQLQQARKDNSMIC